MAYVQPEENLDAVWINEGLGGARLIMTYRGREWERHVAPGDLVTVIEAAALLRVSRTAPYQWMNQNRIRWTNATLVEGKEVKAILLEDLRRFALENGFPLS